MCINDIIMAVRKQIITICAWLSSVLSAYDEIIEVSLDI